MKKSRMAKVWVVTAALTLCLAFPALAVEAGVMRRDLLEDRFIGQSHNSALWDVYKSGGNPRIGHQFSEGAFRVFNNGGTVYHMYFNTNMWDYDGYSIEFDYTHISGSGGVAVGVPQLERAFNSGDAKGTWLWTTGSSWNLSNPTDANFQYEGGIVPTGSDAGGAWLACYGGNASDSANYPVITNRTRIKLVFKRSTTSMEYWAATYTGPGTVPVKRATITNVNQGTTASTNGDYNSKNYIGFFGQAGWVAIIQNVKITGGASVLLEDDFYSATLNAKWTAPYSNGPNSFAWGGLSKMKFDDIRQGDVLAARESIEEIAPHSPAFRANFDLQVTDITGGAAFVFAAGIKGNQLNGAGVQGAGAYLYMTETKIGAYNGGTFIDEENLDAAFNIAAKNSIRVMGQNDGTLDVFYGANMKAPKHSFSGLDFVGYIGFGGDADGFSDTLTYYLEYCKIDKYDFQGAGGKSVSADFTRMPDEEDFLVWDYGNAGDVVVSGGKLVFDNLTEGQKCHFAPLYMYDDFTLRFDIEVTDKTGTMDDFKWMSFAFGKPDPTYVNAGAKGFYFQSSRKFGAAPSGGHYGRLDLFDLTGSNGEGFANTGDFDMWAPDAGPITVKVIAFEREVEVFMKWADETDSAFVPLIKFVDVNTTGYLSISGLNGACFTIDNFSIKNTSVLNPEPPYLGEKPAAPRNFTLDAGNGRVTLAWSAPLDDGGSGIIKYEVSKDGGKTWETAASNTSHTFTGLTNGAEYTFMLRAVNAVGSGAAVGGTATPKDTGKNNNNKNNNCKKGSAALAFLPALVLMLGASLFIKRK